MRASPDVRRLYRTVWTKFGHPCVSVMNGWEDRRPNIMEILSLSFSILLVREVRV